MSAIITGGLWYASQSGSYGRPWNSIEKSIIGGATYYSENFLKNGQDTFYLKKFNVQGSSPYKHQYMTNVEGAAGEGAKLARAYTDEDEETGARVQDPGIQQYAGNCLRKADRNGKPEQQAVRNHHRRIFPDTQPSIKIRRSMISLWTLLFPL